MQKKLIIKKESNMAKKKSGSKKWMQKAVKKPGALSKRLGIPEEKNIPKSLLNKIVKAKTGETISNPTSSGKKKIKVDTKIQRQANLARTFKKTKK